MATTPYSAIALDFEQTAYRQEQCARALRALATLTEPDPADDKATLKHLRRDDLHSLLSVLADQAIFLATEASDQLRSARQHCA